MNIKYISLIGMLVVATGCAELPKEAVWQAEVGYQLAHGIDVLQTMNGPAKDKCYEEDNALTRKLIGRKPSVGQVAVWGVAGGAAHYGVTWLMVKYDVQPWIQAVWQSVTIVVATDTVVNNWDIGIRPWGDNTGGCNK